MSPQKVGITDEEEQEMEYGIKELPPLIPGDRVFFKFSPRDTFAATIQGFNTDGSARLWVASVMSIYRVDAGEGESVGQYSRVYSAPTVTRPLPPEFHH